MWADLDPGGGLDPESGQIARGGAAAGEGALLGQQMDHDLGGAVTHAAVGALRIGALAGQAGFPASDRSAGIGAALGGGARVGVAHGGRDRADAGLQRGDARLPPLAP